MSRIRGKDTAIEVVLRKELWKRNMRYRKNAKKVRGKPDIAFIGLKIAVGKHDGGGIGGDGGQRVTGQE